MSNVNKDKLFPLMVTIVIVGLLLYFTPGFAITITINMPNGEIYRSGDVNAIEFNINITIPGNELIPINEVRFTIVDVHGNNRTCNLPLNNGSYEINCNDYNISVFVYDNCNYEYGHLNVKEPFNYTWGFGYGYGASNLGCNRSYNITWKLINPYPGNYTVEIKIISDGKEFIQKKKFTILHPCQDADGDGYGVCPNCNTTHNCTYDGDDCNDSNSGIHPGATEVCNNIDDNCNNQIDEGNVCFTTYYCDNDSDTYFDKQADGTCNSYKCVPAGCRITQGNDCNDTNTSIKPGAIEICENGIDEDCNGFDLKCGECQDADGDGYGVCPNCNNTLNNCIYNGNDCDDTNNLIHPGAAETCNGVDDNCDGITDISNGINTCPLITYYCDGDGDGYISNISSGTCSIYNCVPVNCSAIRGNDCNDNNNSIHPGATELYNGVDDNCNGLTDYGKGEITNFVITPAGRIIKNTDIEFKINFNNTGEMNLNVTPCINITKPDGIIISFIGNTTSLDEFSSSVLNITWKANLTPAYYTIKPYIIYEYGGIIKTAAYNSTEIRILKQAGIAVRPKIVNVELNPNKKAEITLFIENTGEVKLENVALHSVTNNISIFNFTKNNFNLSNSNITAVTMYVTSNKTGYHTEQLQITANNANPVNVTFNVNVTSDAHAVVDKQETVYIINETQKEIPIKDTLNLQNTGNKTIINITINKTGTAKEFINIDNFTIPENLTEDNNFAINYTLSVPNNTSPGTYTTDVEICFVGSPVRCIYCSIDVIVLGSSIDVDISERMSPLDIKAGDTVKDIPVTLTNKGNETIIIHLIARDLISGEGKKISAENIKFSDNDVLLDASGYNKRVIYTDISVPPGTPPSIYSGEIEVREYGDNYEIRFEKSINMVINVPVQEIITDSYKGGRGGASVRGTGTIPLPGQLTKSEAGIILTNSKHEGPLSITIILFTDVNGSVIITAPYFKEPADVVPLTDDFVVYFGIDVVNISNEDIKNRIIELIINKSWMDENYVNKRTVKLWHYLDGWKEVRVNATENECFIKLTAQVVSFSYFALTAKYEPQLQIDVSSMIENEIFFVKITYDLKPVANASVKYNDEYKNTDTNGTVNFTAKRGKCEIIASKKEYMPSSLSVCPKLILNINSPDKVTVGEKFDVVVTDIEGNLIKNVKVIVKYNSGKTDIATTDEKGLCTFTASENGTIVITAQGEEYKSMESISTIEAKIEESKDDMNLLYVLIGIILAGIVIGFIILRFKKVQKFKTEETEKSEAEETEKSEAEETEKSEAEETEKSEAEETEKSEAEETEKSEISETEKLPENVRCVLNEKEMNVINILSKEDHLTQTEICSKIGIPRATASYCLNRLELRGMIKRFEKGTSKVVTLEEWVKNVLYESKGNEYWLRIVLALREENNLNQKTLSERTNIPEATLSNILRIVEENGIIRKVKHGMSVIIQLAKYQKN